MLVDFSSNILSHKLIKRFSFIKEDCIELPIVDACDLHEGFCVVSIGIIVEINFNKSLRSVISIPCEIEC